MFGQTLSSYSTVSVDFSDNEVYGSGIYYQKTIGMYPQMTISCFDATYNGDVTGFLSISSDAIACKTYRIDAQFLIRDIVQHKFSDTVYFCGTKRLQNPDDTIGVMGFFVVGQTGTINGFYYCEINEVQELTDIVSIQYPDYCMMASIGKKRNSSLNYDYFFTYGYKNPVNNAGVYYIAPLTHNSIPFDLIQTDDFVTILSKNDMNNTIYFRKFNKYDFNDAICDDVNGFLPVETVIFGPYSSFKGCDSQENQENEIVIAYVGFDEYFTWHTYVKTIDLETNMMTNAQSHKSFDKNDLWGVTYLANSDEIAVLELFEPNYQYFNSTAVIIHPNKTQGYTSTELYGRYLDGCISISRLYESTSSVSYFLCGSVGVGGRRYFAHDAGFLMADNCIVSNDIEIEIDDNIEFEVDIDLLVYDQYFVNFNGILPSYSANILFNPCYSLKNK